MCARSSIPFVKLSAFFACASAGGRDRLSHSPTFLFNKQCKSLGHEYEPSKRTDSWLKVKKDYIEGLHDTLDLVPIAAW